MTTKKDADQPQGNMLARAASSVATTNLLIIIIIIICILRVFGIG